MYEKRNLRKWLVISAALVVVLHGKVRGDGIYSGGSGEPNEPYLISTAADMNELGTHIEDWGAYFVLTADINMAYYNETNFNIIGNESNGFSGVFDGNGYSISNFSWDSTSTIYTGLFGYVDGNDAEIKDVRMVDPNIRGSNYVGALAGGVENGAVSGCGVEGGSVSGDYCGGLVGSNRNQGVIINCYATDSVSGDYYIGGLVGLNHDYGAIWNSYSEGIVSGDYYVGGLVGVNLGSVTSSYSAGKVSGIQGIGGLIGFNVGSASDCYAVGEISGEFVFGGLIGSNSGDVNDCFWDVNSSGQSGSAGGTGKTTVEMQTLSTFTDAGWDFVGESINGPNDVWRMCIDGVSYPLFVWQFVAGDFICPDGVEFRDFVVFANTWRLDAGEAGYNPICDISSDETIDMSDLKVFLENWLAGVE